MKNILNKELSKGFSLVETAVVVMILSVLIASIISGKALIENSSIRSFVNETTTLRMKVKKFYDIYGFLPGDHPNASQTIKIGLINGNGDGRIAINNKTTQNNTIVTNAITSATVNEVYTLFLHLYATGTVDIPYTGLPLGGASANQITALNVNVPESKAYQGVAMYFHSDLRPEMSGNPNLKKPSLILEASSLSTQDNTTGFGTSGAVSPDIAYKIDIKVDDGLPYEGNFFAYTSTTNSSQSCTSNNANIYETGIKYTSNVAQSCIISFSITEYNYS